MNRELAEKKIIMDERRRTVEILINDIEEKSSKANKRQEEATAAAQQISEVTQCPLQCAVPGGFRRGRRSRRAFLWVVARI